MCLAAGSPVQLCTFRCRQFHRRFRYEPGSVADAFTICGRLILLARSRRPLCAECTAKTQ